MAYERRYKVTSTLQDAYKTYNTSYEPINKKLYIAIAYDILKHISNMIITNSLEYRIPNKLGFIRIKKTKPKLKIREGRIDVNKNIIDWKATWDAWNEMYPNKTRKEIKLIKDKRVIFQTNNHTDGEVMRWYWDRSVCNIKNNSIYSFARVKGGIFDGLYTGRLGLAQWIKSEDKTNDYYY